MGEDQVRLKLIELIGESFAGVGAQAVVLGPLGDHAGRPAQLRREIAKPARWMEPPADLIPGDLVLHRANAHPHGACGEVINRLRVRQRVQRVLVEQVIVKQEVEVQQNARIPLLDGGADGVLPVGLPRKAGMVVAYAVDAQDTNGRHGFSIEERWHTSIV